MKDQSPAAYDRTFNSCEEFYRNSAYSVFPQEHRTAGSFGLHLMKVQQDPFDLIDAAIPDWVFCKADHPNHFQYAIDLGDGLVAGKEQMGITIYPAYTESRTIARQALALTCISMADAKLKTLLSPIRMAGSSFSAYLSRVTPSKAAQDVMERMWSVSSRIGPSANLFLDGLTLQFFALLLDTPALAPLAQGKPENKRIARVIDYIEAHYSAPLTIADLAAVACLSPTHFSPTFKASTGEAVWAYVQRRRCERARQMLLDTDTAISNIAYQCGFASQSHMTTSFSQQFGHTPAAYRMAR